MVILTPLFIGGIRSIFRPGAKVVDIGAGLRAVKGKGDRYDPAQAWVLPLMEGVDYKTLDPVDTYNPDIIGDIHALPFGDQSLDALICLSVLEHVEDPFLACREMLRVLKPGGTLVAYVPFLFYYHAEGTYYKDFWRFTDDGIRVLLKDFKEVRMEQSRGALETWVALLPWGSRGPLSALARLADKLLGKRSSKQAAGYYIVATA